MSSGGSASSSKAPRPSSSSGSGSHSHSSHHRSSSSSSRPSSNSAASSSSAAAASSSSSSSSSGSSEETRKARSHFLCELTYFNAIPRIPTAPKLLRVPPTADLAALTTCYDDESIDATTALPLHFDRFGAVPLDPIDLSRYSWPSVLGPRRLDPLDADIISPDVLAAARRAPRPDLILPSASIIDEARVSATHGSLARIVRRAQAARARPAAITDATKRAEEMREALQARRLNFLNVPEYAEDKGLMWQGKQELLRKAAAGAGAGTGAAGAGAAEAAEDVEATLTPEQRIERSFELAKILPQHPSHPEYTPTHVLDLVPDERLAFAPSASSGLVWAGFTRIEDALTDADAAAAAAKLREAAQGTGKASIEAEAALRALAATAGAAAAREGVLAWTYAQPKKLGGIVTAAGNLGRAGEGGLGLYRPITAATVAAAAAAGKQAKAAAKAAARAEAAAANAGLFGSDDDDDDEGQESGSKKKGDDDGADDDDEEDEDVEGLGDEELALLEGGDATLGDNEEDDSDDHDVGLEGGMHDNEYDDNDDDDDDSLEGMERRRARRARAAAAAAAAAEAAAEGGVPTVALGKVRNTPSEAAAAAAEVKLLQSAAAGGPASVAAADAAVAGAGAVALGWVRELVRGPVEDTARDDNLYFVFGTDMSAAPKGEATAAGGTVRGVVRYGRLRQRVSLKKRIASAQDPCDKAIRSRPAHIVLKRARVAPVAKATGAGGDE